MSSPTGPRPAHRSHGEIHGLLGSQRASNPRSWLAENETRLVVSENAPAYQRLVQTRLVGSTRI
jgi:hypothetical protein